MTARVFLAFSAGVVLCAGLGTSVTLGGAQPKEKDQAAIREAHTRLQDAWRNAFKKGEPTTKPPSRHSLGVAKKSDRPFENPPEVRVTKDEKIELKVAKSHLKIGDDKVFLRTYNGRLVGPTIRAKPGDTIRITLHNDLDPNPAVDPETPNTLHGFNTTNLHTHGLHVSPAGKSDNVLLEVQPKSKFDYEIKIPANHTAGTYWYHAHNHGSVAAQVGSGMSGALIIEGGEDAVPEIAAATERVMVLQQIPYIKSATATEGTIELEDIDISFGPGTWAKLDRYTTVNGQVLPVIKMQPGSVERWRIVDSGVRETINFRLLKVDGGDLTDTLPLNEIAADGISLGEVVERSDAIELWPGYRSDVLVQAPQTPGEYLIVDDTAPAERTISGLAKDRAFIGRLSVAGKAKPMALPKSAALAKFRPPSIAPAAVTGKQTATYGLLPNPTGKGILFTIDGKPFDPTKPRVLTLGQVDDWTVQTVNDKSIGTPTHPFHIHVNPFEVYSILDDKGVEQLKKPVWKDTIAMPDRWTIKFRTKYTNFTGDFVQHCHILDHEDQGMMQVIRIQAAGKPKGPQPAGAWALPDAAGKVRTSAEFRDRPVVLVFSKGFGCAHCSEQVAAFKSKADDFRKRGVDVVFVTTDSVKALEKAQARGPLPFLIVSDPDGATFLKYGCHDGQPRHGTYAIDASGTIRWETPGPGPLMDVETVLKEVDRFAPSK